MGSIVGSTVGIASAVAVRIADMAAAVASSRLDAPTWGRAERVFNDVEPGDRTP